MSTVNDKHQKILYRCYQARSNQLGAIEVINLPYLKSWSGVKSEIQNLS